MTGVETYGSGAAIGMTAASHTVWFVAALGTTMLITAACRFASGLHLTIVSASAGFVLPRIFSTLYFSPFTLFTWLFLYSITGAKRLVFFTDKDITEMSI
jgi:hypothetical protein